MKRKYFILLSALLLQACATMGGLRNEPLTAGFAQEFEGTFEEVLQATRESVVSAGLSIEEANQLTSGTWVIMAKKGTSIFSWGELVRILVEQHQEEAPVVVRVITKRKGTLNLTAKGDYSDSIFSGIRLALGGSL